MPYGLRNIDSTFQGLIDHVLSGQPFIFVYLDIILVASPDHASYQLHLRQVLCRLRENDLMINPNKLVFM